MEKLIAFIKDITEDTDVDILSDTDLIEEGIIDSLNIVKIINYIEEKTKTEIKFEELDLDDIRTPAIITSNYLSMEVA